MYTLSLQSHIWYLHDQPKRRSSQEILEQYIRNAHTLFSSRATILTDFESTFENGDERRLKDMLDLLIQARHALEEESD